MNLEDIDSVGNFPYYHLTNRRYKRSSFQTGFDNTWHYKIQIEEPGES